MTVRELSPTYWTSEADTQAGVMPPHVLAKFALVSYRISAEKLTSSQRGEAWS